MKTLKKAAGSERSREGISQRRGRSFGAGERDRERGDGRRRGEGREGVSPDDDFIERLEAALGGGAGREVFLEYLRGMSREGPTGLLAGAVAGPLQ